MEPTSRDAGLILLFKQSEWNWLMASGVEAPENVYHYTTALGFAGILLASTLRATNFSFLNDPSEVQYGRDLALGLLGKLGRTGPRENQRLIFDTLDAFMQKVVSESYVSCFTELSDDLSQWRAYGTSAMERYCIGFDAKQLSSVFSTRPGGRFAKVIYDVQQQDERISSVLMRAANFVEKNAIEPNNRREVAEAVADVIAWVLPELKNPAYKHEAEWRVIRWHDNLPHDSLSFETSRGVLRPFLPVSLSPLPITSVQVMAPTRKHAALKATDMLLRTANISSAVIGHSKVPFAE